MTLDEFFLGFEDSRPLFDAVQKALNTVGPTEMRVTKSQVSFWRRKAVVRVWLPARYLRGKTAPLVFTFAFQQRDASLRWKEIVEPAPGQFTHHLEIFSTVDLDEEVLRWLRQAWENAA